MQSEIGNKKTRLVILGGGESGVGAAILAKDLGMDVFLSDYGNIPEKYVKILDNENIAFEQGGHTPELILNATEIVKSPGIPPTAPIMQSIYNKGIPVISEIEFAGRYTDSKMVCITGSNGKTTTTMLTYHILHKAGIDVGLFTGPAGGTRTAQSICYRTLKLPTGKHVPVQSQHSGYAKHNP